MRSAVLIVPGRLDTHTGGYGYDRRIVGGLRAQGWSVDVREIDGSFPYPSAAARAQAEAVFAAIPAGRAVLVDGLALGALPREAERHSARLRLVALVHHPLARETGLDARTAADFEASERAALASARKVVVTGLATASIVSAYGVPSSNIVVVEPGTDRSSVARGSGTSSPHMLCVATITPRKGHEILLRALASLETRHWQLTCVGSTDRDPAMSERLRGLVHDLDLDGLVAFAGEATGAALDAHYDAADVFVLATLYEGYGMAVAEALARGLPVVSTATGSIPEIVVGGSGVLVPPGDVEALAGALRTVLNDADARARLAANARRVRNRLPTWDEAATKMAAVLERVASG
jgi:glycosyltransferase involved in cell wall biosynthesis